jgi:DNA-binding MarR family transcriptional regulator
LSRAEISLLFDFFVTSQRLRRVLTDALADAGMRPDEYAVYSLLLEKGPLTATEMSEMLGMPLTTVLDYVRAESQPIGACRAEARQPALGGRAEKH